jgi:glutamate 5-kinase
MSHFKVCLAKLGSKVVSDVDGGLDIDLLASVCRQISELYVKGWRTILVTSGAMVTGRAVLNAHHVYKKSSGAEVTPISAPRFVDDRRALSAIGQSQLVAHYAHFLQKTEFPLVPGQILLSREALSDRERYVTIRDTLIDMLRHEIVPIINANDPTNSRNFDFIDNDQIAAYVAGMVDADQVVLVSDIEGVFDKNPKSFVDATRIGLLPIDQRAWPEIAIDDAGSSFGGMANKLETLRLLNNLGISARVACKSQADVILRSVLDPNENFGTRLASRSKPRMSQFKRWLCTGAYARGIVVVSEPGARAFREKASSGESISLLDVGVLRCHGAFERGDPITLHDVNYRLLGIGQSRLGAGDIERAKNRVVLSREHRDVRAGASETLLLTKPLPGSRIIVHADELVPVSRTAYLLQNIRELIHSHVSRLKSLGFNIVENKAGGDERNTGGLIRIANKHVSEGGKYQAASGITYRDMEARTLWHEALQASQQIRVSPNDWIVFRCLT